MPQEIPVESGYRTDWMSELRRGEEGGRWVAWSIFKERNEKIKDFKGGQEHVYS